MTLPTLFSGTGAPSVTAYEGAVYLREDAPNGSVYVGKGGVWTLLAGGGGGSVTLAGDVTGPSGSNAVVALSGGIVAQVSVTATQLRIAASVTSPTWLQIAAASGDGQNWTFIAQDGFGTGNTFGGAINLLTGAGHGTGSAGPINFEWGGVGIIATFDPAVSGLQLNQPNLLFGAAVLLPTIGMRARGNDSVSGQTIFLIGQATGTAGGAGVTGGAIVVRTGASNAGGSPGLFAVQLGSGPNQKFEITNVRTTLTNNDFLVVNSGSVPGTPSASGPLAYAQSGALKVLNSDGLHCEVSPKIVSKDMTPSGNQGQVDGTDLNDLGDLELSIGANERWVFRYTLRWNVTASSGAGIRVAAIWPVGATAEVHALGVQTFGAGGHAGPSLISSMTGTSGAPLIMNLVTSDEGYVEMHLFVSNGGTPGIVRPQFSQGASAPGTTTTVFSTSFMTAHRVA